MSLVWKLIKLTRPLNAMLVFAALLVARIIIMNYYRPNSVQPVVNIVDYLVMILIGMLILGAGNVINDIIDYKIDLINKPKKALIPNHISLQKAIRFYYILNGIAVLMSLYLVIKYNVLFSFIIPFLAILILYVYSKYLKKSFFLGNFTIALLCGALSLVGFWVERSNLLILKPTHVPEYNVLIYSFICIGVFCFLLVLNRELIKDCEDVEGDRSQGAHTLPIVLGLKWSNRIIFFYFILYAIVFTILNIIRIKEIYNVNIIICTIIYLMVFVFGIAWVYRKYQGKRLYSALSALVKLYLVLGLIMMLF
ncbi:MAG: UbiA family prenyltransferase [Saprospiraceae bacterium]|jgi:4-hydroxybenzoate polyprenyltransferase|nr:UbiA family prenyltransferase [Saprospiraceae bacterium]